MTINLSFYMDLERVMMAMDDAGEELADDVREILDTLWYKRLTEEERATLNSRPAMSTAHETQSAIGLYAPASTDSDKAFAIQPFRGDAQGLYLVSAA